MSSVGDCSLLDGGNYCSDTTCNGQFDSDGSDNWIQCDKCNKWYHYQCSGLDYAEEDYDMLELETLDFNCMACS